ncbi:MAG: hypothetical protein ACK4UN_02575, partial [Limisphaerales bacterium]
MNFVVEVVARGDEHTLEKVTCCSAGDPGNDYRRPPPLRHKIANAEGDLRRSFAERIIDRS